MWSSERRRLLRGAALASATALLGSGCGFALRRPPELSFHTLQLSGFAPRSPLAAALTARIHSSASTRVVASAAEADVVLHALTDTRQRVVLASTSAGQVRELQLKLHLRYRLKRASGALLIPDAELLLTRDMSYSEGTALAKEDEAEQLFRAMQDDVVDQLMRRLAAISATQPATGLPPAPAPAASPASAP